MDVRRTEAFTYAAPLDYTLMLFRTPSGSSVLVQIDKAAPNGSGSSQLVVNRVADRVLVEGRIDKYPVSAVEYGGSPVTESTQLVKALQAATVLPADGGYGTLVPAKVAGWQLVDDSQRHVGEVGTDIGYQVQYVIDDSKGAQRSLTIDSHPVRDGLSVEIAAAALTGDVLGLTGDRRTVGKPEFTGEPSRLSWVESNLLVTISGSMPLDTTLLDAASVVVGSDEQIQSPMVEMSRRQLDLPLIDTSKSDASIQLRGTPGTPAVVCIATDCAQLSGLATLASVDVRGRWLVVAVYPIDGPQPKIVSTPPVSFTGGTGETHVMSVAEVADGPTSIEFTISVEGVSLTTTLKRPSAGR